MTKVAIVQKPEGSSKQAPDKFIRFEKPNFSKGIGFKGLYIKAIINGVEIGKILVDGGAAINLLPLKMLPEVKKAEGDLVLADFNVFRLREQLEF